MDIAQQKEYIVSTIVARFGQQNNLRHNAISELLDVTLPHLDKAAIAGIAAMVPELPTSLYTKWAELFAQRLLETVSPRQINDMCNGTQEGLATLSLVFIMFMESEKMEKIVAEDLAALGASATDADSPTSLLATWLKYKMTTPIQ